MSPKSPKVEATTLETNGQAGLLSWAEARYKDRMEIQNSKYNTRNLRH
jgi:hypothetical protein